MGTPSASTVCIEPLADDALTAASEAILRLFEAGLIDEDSATLALLAISIGVRRVARGDPALDDSGHTLPPRRE